tara:strand:+ start:446 stop:652 length:207 start_codon:yes stop_codon:yes gene_type:complete
MFLNILVIAFIMMDGSFKGDIYVVDECPKLKDLVIQLEKKMMKGEIMGWSAKCSQFDFVPVDITNNYS